MSRILAVAGEASGDALLAPAVAALRARGHAVVGVGGPRAVAAGLEPIHAYAGLAGHGLVEALRTAPAVIAAARRLRPALAEVDAALLVDFPELNSRLLRWSPHPVAWLAPPQAWAWRAHRAQRVATAGWVGCLFDFAAAWYRARGVPAESLGHPSAGRGALPFAGAADVALLPGSRGPTVARLLPIFLAAASRYSAAHPGVTFHLGLAPGLTAPPAPRGVRLVIHAGAEAALAASGTCWAGAGTATLDAVLAGRPVLVCARLHPLSERIAGRLVRVPMAGLPNLILGRAVFPERVFSACTPAQVADAGGQLTAARVALAPAVEAVRRRCACAGFGGRVADAVDRLLRA